MKWLIRSMCVVMVCKRQLTWTICMTFKAFQKEEKGKRRKRARVENEVQVQFGWWACERPAASIDSEPG